MASLYNDHLAFIHVPKTGGTWVTKALRAAGVEFTEVMTRRGHAWWDELPADRFRFGFVRDPEAWYRSFWTHRKSVGDHEPRNPFDAVMLDSEDLEEFVHLASEQRLVEKMYEEFLGPPGAIEFVGHYETLVDDLVDALAQAGECWEWEVEEFRRLLGETPTNIAESRARELLSHAGGGATVVAGLPRSPVGRGGA